MMTVSVVTPALNVEACLDQCIASVAGQSYPVMEHIVVDGGSTDKTQQIARENGAVLITGKDAGLYHAMSKGIQAAKGDVIHILNADDKYRDADVVRDMIEKFANENLDMCHAKLTLVEDGVQVAVLGRDTNREVLIGKQRVAHPTVFVKRSVYEQFGLFSPSFRIAGDLDWLLRVWDKINIGFLDRIVVEMDAEGLSHQYPYRSYKEALAVALIHGQGIFKGLVNLYKQAIFHFVVIRVRAFTRRKATPG